MHTATAAELFGGGGGLAAVTPEERRRAKTINFGLIYGMSTYGLSQSLVRDHPTGPGREKGELVGSHGRWRGPRLQTARMTL